MRRQRPRRHTVAAAAIAITTWCTGCAVGADPAPRDILPARADDDIVAEPADGVAAGGEGRVYLLAPEVAGLPTRLQAVPRDVGADPARALRALVAGPNQDEFDASARTAVPVALEVAGVRRRPDGVVIVDVGAPLRDLTGDPLLLALAQIVYTLTAVDGVTGVLLTVEGRTLEWPASNGQLRSEPLTVFDYPGLEPSAQPAFPALPG
jgi:hypothetical protein